MPIRIWKLVTALFVVAIAVMWYRVVHQQDEILALVRNEVLSNDAGQRTWKGSFVNTNDQTLRDVVVAVDFLDSQNQPIGRANAAAAELPYGTRLDLQSPLPPEAARLRIHTVQWRMGSKAATMGPFRDPWEFGYLMAQPTAVSH